MTPYIPNDPYIIVDIDNVFSGTRKSYVLINPIDIIKADNYDEIHAALGKIDEYSNLGKYLSGYFSYEATRCLMDFKASRGGSQPEFPLLWFAVFDAPEIPEKNYIPKDYYLSDPEADVTLEKYSKGFKKIKQYISDGFVYQVNYTFPSHFSFFGDPVSLFYDLKANQGSSYNFMLSFKKKQILSLSPELFFYRNKNKIWTKPMKGTIARNPDAVLDRENKNQLRNSSKNQAENAMITDILRNDLGMLCEKGSVKVEKYLDIEQYPTLYQMTSTVTGLLNPGTSYQNIFKSLFPIASVTGAPKYEAMKKIHEIENYDRGIYTGAIGVIEPGGEAIFNVAIRTLILNQGKGKIGVGSGIVFDSDNAGEYSESLLKMSFLGLKKKDFFLFETILLKNGKYVLLKLHLDRLKISASTFGFQYPENEINQELEILKNNIILNSEIHEKYYRIKLILYPDGNFRIEHQPYFFTNRRKRMPYRVVLSEEKIESGNIFVYHKTNFRGLYDHKYKEAIEQGYDEIIFLNERDEISECSIHNIIAKIDNKWYTPKINSGLLPGTFRQYLLNKKFLIEKTITLDDLKKASKICLINSLRGINEAVLIEHFL